MRARAAAGLVAGLLLTAALPPFGWWPLALVGAGLLAMALEDQPWRPRLAAGLGAGAGFVYPGLWWMTEFSLPGFVVAALLETALFALTAVVTPPGRWRWLGLPAALVAVEAFRGIWPFGGVPIATVAQTQVGGPVAQTLRIGGPLLVAGVVGIAGVGVAALRARRPRLAAVALASVVLACAGGAMAADGVRAGRLRTALVQGGGERGTRAIHTPAGLVHDAHRRATDLVRPGTQLVLWPEDVVDVDEPLAGTPLAADLAELADELDATLVAGIVEDSGDERFRNYAQAWSSSGQLGQRYEKHQRVPFGEHIPFRPLIEKVADVSAVPRDAHVGTGPSVLATEVGRLGVSISYEVFFARRARAAVHGAGGGEILLVPTNASSYSSTQMPALELAAARMRAIETGRWVLQAAPTGFTAAVDQRGRVRDRTDLGRRQVLHVEVPRRTGATPYTRLGDGPFVVGSLLALALAWARTRRADTDLGSPARVSPVHP